MNLRELCIKACNKDIISINILNDKKIKIIDDNIEKYMTCNSVLVFYF